MPRAIYRYDEEPRSCGAERLSVTENFNREERGTLPPRTFPSCASIFMRLETRRGLKDSSLESPARREACIFKRIEGLVAPRVSALDSPSFIGNERAALRGVMDFSPANSPPYKFPLAACIARGAPRDRENSEKNDRNPPPPLFAAAPCLRP